MNIVSNKIKQEIDFEQHIVHIITSYVRGWDIQYRFIDRVKIDEEWIDMVAPMWNFIDIEFRIKPVELDEQPTYA